ncbi:MAG: DUF4880 domain-containing protein [Alphaproteobacteria bacterium]|nr:DUF4880 domain-containing protein [Alphaproteobacteria bacterium]
MARAGPGRQDEAAAWFAAQRAGVMLAEERQAFDEWRADPRNQAALDAMHELWGELAILKDAPPPTRARRGGVQLAVVAALVLAVVGGGSIAVSMLAAGNTIRTEAGQQKTQSLPDGSLVAVNVASRISYAINETHRFVRLKEGEAAFSVKASLEHPFIVKAGDYELRATGTAFNVRQRDGRIEVAVGKGRVSVCSAVGPNAGVTLASLEAGQLLTFPSTYSSSAFADLRPTDIAPEDVSEWRERVVTYEDASVRDVVRDFNRYFDKKLLVAPSGLEDRRVTIRLQVEDRDRAIATLAELLNVGVRQTPDGEMLVE